ncbi:MAG TPA: FAD binding domain-containing protein [Candidatus Eisenbacteria bacterium]|nr:FAD binding domain-containing protein [Candidatus Eisenbacteria bacterium]
MLPLPPFEWAEPASLDELLALLATHGRDALIVAGGTDAVPNLKHRLHEPRVVVSTARVPELQGIVCDADGLQLGAGVTLAALARDERVARAHPALTRAAGLVAGPQLRAMGTVGGNLCLDTRCTYYNQTYFWRAALGFCLKNSGTVCHVVPAGKRCVAAHSSDLAPVLIALGATLAVAGPSGARTMPVDAFFVADGIHNNVLQPGEVVTRVHVPAEAQAYACGYQKLRPRAAIDFPMLSVAFAVKMNGVVKDARLVVSAIAARPRVVTGVDALLRGGPLDAPAIEAVAQLAARQCHPLINVPYDAEWRKAMVPVYVRRAAREALGLPPVEEAN